MPELSRFFGIVIRMYSEIAGEFPARATEVESGSMTHRMARVQGFAILGQYTLRIQFDDGSDQVIDFEPILRGEVYGPLRDPLLFAQVQVDAEAHTLVWPNGADFDPATLHDWPACAAAFREMAEQWA